MKQKRRMSFFLGLILIVSMLVGLGRTPAVSMAVTTTTLSLQDQVTSLQNQILIQKLLALIAQLQAQLQQLIAAKANPTVQCGWCGNSCINWAGKDRSSTVCANVMPPADSFCQNINGTCQITNSATKYSCSTVVGTIPGNNYTGCIPSANGTFNSLAECQNSCPVSKIPTISSIVPNQVSANTRVTIYGTNLSGATNVKFFDLTGQESASLELPSTGSIVTPNSIEFTISGLFAYNSDPGTYQVKVVTPSGTSNGLNFTLLAPSTTKAYCSAKYGNSGLNGLTLSQNTMTADQCRQLALALTPERKYMIREEVCANINNGESEKISIGLEGNPTSFLDFSAQCSDFGSRPTVFISGQTYVNANQPAQYGANVTGGTSPYSFVWSTDGLVSSSKDSNVGNYKWTQPGSHTVNVRVTDSKGTTVNGNLTVTVTPTATPTCTDSDGGVNYNVKGTTSGMAGNNVFTTDADYCSGNNLVEWFCSGVYRINTNYICPNGCENGACKPVVASNCDATCKAQGYSGGNCIGSIREGVRPVCPTNTVDVGPTYGCSKNADPDLIGLPTCCCAPKPPATNCSWCGNVCVLSSTLAGRRCPDTVPPAHSTCTLVSGVCTATNGGVVEGVETHIFSENLGYGMENEDVRALQSILAAKGYFSGTVSGYFGWQTEEAVKAFQTANNLPATGLVGPLTRELLNK